jgi:hypothetical protein
MFETPPLILHPGHSRLISRVALQIKHGSQLKEQMQVFG